MRSAAEAANGACSASAPASSSVALFMVGSPGINSELAGYIDTDGAWLIGRHARNGRLLPREYRVIDRQRRQFVGEVGGGNVRRPLTRDDARFQVHEVMRRQGLAVVRLILDRTDQRARKVEYRSEVVVDRPLVIERRDRAI